MKVILFAWQVVTYLGGQIESSSELRRAELWKCRRTRGWSLVPCCSRKLPGDPQFPKSAKDCFPGCHIAQLAALGEEAGRLPPCWEQT